MHHLLIKLRARRPGKEGCAKRGARKGVREEGCAKRGARRGVREEGNPGSLKARERDDQSCSAALNNLRVIYLTGTRAAKKPISRTVKKTYIKSDS